MNRDRVTRIGVLGLLLVAVGLVTPRPLVAHEEGVQQIVEVTVDALPATPAAIELASLSLSPGAGRELIVPGPEIYVVEGGTPGIRVDGPALLTHAPVNGVLESPVTLKSGVDYTLTFGDQVVVFANVPHALLNDGLETATFLNIVVFPASALVPSWLPDEVLPAGVGILPLASAVIDDPTQLPTAPVRVALSRIAVAGEAGGGDGTLDQDSTEERSPSSTDEGWVALGELSGRFAVVVVEQGILSVARDGQGDETYRPGEVVRLAPDEPASLQNGSEGVLVALGLTIDSLDTEANEALVLSETA